MHKLVRGQCAKDAVGEAEEDTMDRFKLFVEEDGENKDTKRLIDEFRKSNKLIRVEGYKQQRINQRYT